MLSIRYPMEHGIVRDWNDMERIWQYVYSKDQLQTFSEEVIIPPLALGFFRFVLGCQDLGRRNDDLEGLLLPSVRQRQMEETPHPSVSRCAWQGSPSVQQS